MVERESSSRRWWSAACVEALGVRPYEARERADRFRIHNLKTLEDMLPHWQDVTERTNMARSSREQLERQMERDRADLDREHGHGWHQAAEAGEES